MKICSLYGAGYYYIPGTDTCIKIGGYVRAEWNVNANGSFNPFRQQNFDDPAKNRYVERSRAGLTADVRSQTEYGTLRGYLTVFPTFTPSNATNGGTPYANTGVFAPAAFIQFAGFTWGKTASFFDFDLQPYSNITNYWGSNQAGNGQQIFGYTAQFGNGFSASISAEDPNSRRSAVAGAIGGVAGASAYGGRRWPDVVGNLHVDQAWGSAQIMGAIHDVYGYTATTTATASDTGWAVGGGVKFLTPFTGKNDYVIAQVAYGEGAMNYIGSNFGAGGAGATAGFNFQSGYNLVSSVALGPVFDAVGTGTGYDLTTGWSVTAGFEHWWVPNWKTSLYGSYGELKYSSAASAVISGVAGTNAGWNYWQIGSRTVWTPVPNLDLSVDVVYNSAQTAFGGLPCAGGVGVGALAAGSAIGAGCTFQNKDFVAGILRAQRNFYP